MTPLRSNPVVHLELHTGDLPQARDLYAELCGWRPEWIETRAGSYLSLELGDGLGGGIVECGIRHPLWLPYVEVAELGALRLAPGMDRDASRLLPLPGARRRARGRDRRVRYPAPALAALRRGRRARSSAAGARNGSRREPAPTSPWSSATGSGAGSSSAVSGTRSGCPTSRSPRSPRPPAGPAGSGRPSSWRREG